MSADNSKPCTNKILPIVAIVVPCFNESEIIDDQLISGEKPTDGAKCVRSGKCLSDFDGDLSAIKHIISVYPMSISELNQNYGKIIQSNGLVCNTSEYLKIIDCK